MNRANGPDQVLELAEQRAPNRIDDDLDALLPVSERKRIADEYKKEIAGFDPEEFEQPAKLRSPGETRVLMTIMHGRFSRAALDRSPALFSSL